MGTVEIIVLNIAFIPGKMCVAVHVCSNMLMCMSETSHLYVCVLLPCTSVRLSKPARCVMSACENTLVRALSFEV